MFTFAWPYIFILLPLPWLVWKFLPAGEVKQSAALKIPFFARLQTLNSTSQNNLLRKLRWPQCLAVLIWILLIIALAGPQWLGQTGNALQTGRDLMLAIDLSGSMSTPDLTLKGQNESRLDVVKSIAIPFIQQRVGDRIGLIVFGTRAYLQTPLTFDRQTVEQTLNGDTIALAGPQTAIGDAIGLAVKRLLDYPAKSRAIILLTDGGNNSGTLTPLAAAQLAANEDIKIYTIGIGADSMTVPGLFGPQEIDPSNDLDLDTLKQIAQMTGGEYFRAKNGEELYDIYQKIDQLEPTASDSVNLRPVEPLYPWPLGLALILSMILGVRKVGRFPELRIKRSE